MSDDLSRLEGWVEPLLRRLQPSQRRQLAMAIGRELRRTQAQRIGRQRAPDGSAYPARRQARDKNGRIKRRKMFQKLRQAKHFKIRASAGDVSVGFFGRVARIASVHQEGRMDAVRPGGPRVRYERRQLLGFDPGTEQRIREMLIDHLA